jgi:hypothetical protein
MSNIFNVAEEAAKKIKDAFGSFSGTIIGATLVSTAGVGLYALYMKFGKKIKS